MATYKDIKIMDDEMVLDECFQAPILLDEAVIEQDLRHMLRESGLIEGLLAERSKELRRIIKTQIELLIETDERIVPGTITMTESWRNRLEWELYINAKCELGSNIGVKLSNESK